MQHPGCHVQSIGKPIVSFPPVTNEHLTFVCTLIDRGDWAAPLAVNHIRDLPCDSRLFKFLRNGFESDAAFLQGYLITTPCCPSQSFMPAATAHEDDELTLIIVYHISLPLIDTAS